MKTPYQGGYQFVFGERRIDLLSATTFFGVPVLVLNPDATKLATLSDEDCWYFSLNGRFPDRDRMAIHPAFPYPGRVSADGTTDRREFDQWRREGKVPGRALSLSYDQVITVRHSRSYNDPEIKDIRLYGAGAPKITPSEYYRVRDGRTYWWVQAGISTWEGWSWRQDPLEGEARAALEARKNNRLRDVSKPGARRRQFELLNG